MTPNLTGKTVLVTGANSGIGRALAIAAGAAGARVFPVARDRDRLKAVAAEIGNAAWHAADLTDPAAVDAVAKAAEAELGQVDILLANAGLYIPGEAAESDPDDCGGTRSSPSTSPASFAWSTGCCPR